MKQLQTTGIILTRIEYGEADRIVTLLTPDQGKLRLMARGVRKIKSRLAGGIELFSISDITFIKGRGEIGTLISARLKQHYGNIVRDIDRVQQGYALIKLLNKATEDEPEADYFNLLEQTFLALDDAEVPLDLIEAWFQARLLGFSGHQPNLLTDTEGHDLSADGSYDFDFDAVSFSARTNGQYNADQIKLLRLLFSDNTPRSLARVQGTDQLLPTLKTLLQLLINSYIVRK